MAYGISDMRSGGPYIVVLMVGCVGGGLLLHWTGRGILRRLRE
jgi:hypothetical protein